MHISRNRSLALKGVSKYRGVAGAVLMFRGVAGEKYPNTGMQQ